MPTIPHRPTSPVADIRSSLIMGPSRAGKTYFCATYPRVAWLGSMREQGYETIQHMNESAWYERGYPPRLFGVNSMEETRGYLQRDIPALVVAGKVRTIVIELSFYSDDIIYTLDRPDEKNGWAKYEALAKHMIWIDRWAKANPQVILAYNALAAPPDESAKTPSGILMAGKKTAKIIPAGVTLFGMMLTEPMGTHVDRVLQLEPIGSYVLGHRYGDKLPGKVRNPTYRVLQDLLVGRSWADANGVVTAGSRPANGAIPTLAPLGTKIASPTLAPLAPLSSQGPATTTK